MVRCVSAVMVIGLFLAVPAFSTGLPQILQPTTTAYTPSELPVLMQAIDELQEALDDYTLGSGKTFAPDEWESRDFARYTAGALSEMGYEAKLVSGTGWPDGVHTWVIVGIPLDGKTAWIPVEASPEPGHTQQTLGEVPVVTDPSGGKAFDPRYITFTDLIDLSPNLPPVAKIRVPSVVVGETIKIFALGSYDPDGEIVVYRWCVDEGPCTSSSSWRYSPTRNDVGEHRLTLTVIDSGGRSATVSTSYVIKDPQDDAERKTGCGCGH